MSKVYVPGLELDALVAEKMGDVLCRCDGEPVYVEDCSNVGLEYRWLFLKDGAICGKPGCNGTALRHYSTSISAAWELLKEFTEHGVAVHCCRREEWGDDKWKCVLSLGGEPDSMGRTPCVTARANTAPLAICRAVIMAKCLLDE